jgi:hypothetical protein
MQHKVTHGSGPGEMFFAHPALLMAAFRSICTSMKTGS